MNMLHPAEPFGRPNLHCRWERVGIVECRGLNVDNARENCGISVEQSAPAVGAETPNARRQARASSHVAGMALLYAGERSMVLHRAGVG